MLTEDRARYVMLDVKPGAVVQWVTTNSICEWTPLPSILCSSLSQEPQPQP